MSIKFNQIAIAVVSVILISCSSDQSEVEKKKEELKTLKTQLSEVKTQITTLEEELLKLDSSYAKEKDKSILTAVQNVKPALFTHQIQVRGAVSSNRNVMISSEAMGKIVKIHVAEGQAVKSGQLLVELDADILRNSIQELKTSLDLATTMFEKQKNLWEKNIGTEVQYLQAKNQKESLEKRLNTTYSQLDNYMIKAPFAGQVDNLDIKKGEMMSPGMPICRIVSLEEMLIQSEISEKYIGTFQVGDSVNIEFPSMEIKGKSKISSIGKVINEQNRTFRIEVELPKNLSSKSRPNQVAILTLTDYINSKAMLVPSKIVQKDSKGNYIYITEKSENGLVAKKQHVEIGKSYSLKTEIKNGIKADEQIIIEGYRDVANGSIIKIKS